MRRAPSGARTSVQGCAGSGGDTRAVSPRGVLDACCQRGARAGLTLNPETPVARVLPFVSSVDLMLVMSVRPGFGGQTFIDGSLEKVRALRAALDRASAAAELEVDGGVKLENALAIADAG